MLVRLRREYANLVTSGVQVVLLIAGFKFESRLGWIGVLAVMALISLFAWASALRRRRAIADTPTSRIASAAQGYVEIKGQGQPLDGLPVLTPCSQLPCLWYRYRIERRDSENKWHTEEQGESNASLVVDDGSGVCVVDPAGAEIMTRHKDTWTRGDQRFTEWTLQRGDPIYALGDFHTLHGGDGLLDPAEDLKALLAEWKANPEELHRRFDLDGNGQLDMEEWALARQAARREVAQRHQEARAHPDVNLMRAPADGRLFLVANLDEKLLARRYGLWSLYHLVVFLGALAALPWVWQLRF